jgi:hypothetical protein
VREPLRPAELLAYKPPDCAAVDSAAAGVVQLAGCEHRADAGHGVGAERSVGQARKRVSRGMRTLSRVLDTQTQDDFASVSGSIAGRSIPSLLIARRSALPRR